MKKVDAVLKQIVDLMSEGAPNRLRSVKGVLKREESDCLGNCARDLVFPFLVDMEIEVSENISAEDYIKTIAHEVYHLHCDVYLKNDITEVSASFTEMIVSNVMKYNSEINKLAKQLVELMK